MYKTVVDGAGYFSSMFSLFSETVRRRFQRDVDEMNKRYDEDSSYDEDVSSSSSFISPNPPSVKSCEVWYDSSTGRLSFVRFPVVTRGFSKVKTTDSLTEFQTDETTAISASMWIVTK